VRRSAGERVREAESTAAKRVRVVERPLTWSVELGLSR
jgi:hypothetical protein